MWGQFVRILFPESTPFLSVSPEEGTSKTLGICLKEKEEAAEPASELRDWEGHHGCTPSHWNLPKGNQLMLLLEYSYKLHSFLPYRNIAMYHLPPAWTMTALFSQQAISPEGSWNGATLKNKNHLIKQILSLVNPSLNASPQEQTCIRNLKCGSMNSELA